MIFKLGTVIVGILSCGYAFTQVATSMSPDDRSFFHEPDENDWPSNSLSERQFNDAVSHFHDSDVCKHSWSWALIGPNQWLLKGTNYLLTRVTDPQFIPNIHYSKGFWGGNQILGMSITEGKLVTEQQAADDCAFGDVRDWTRADP